MDKHYTIMIIPEKNKKVLTFRLPKLVFRSLAFILVSAVLLIIIFGHDYKQILDQVYKNKHLTIENRKLRDQLNIFQMKLNGLTNDIQRIHTFEKKLKIIAGIENMPQASWHDNNANDPDQDHMGGTETEVQNEELKKKDHKKDFLETQTSDVIYNLQNLNLDKITEYQELKHLHQQKLAYLFGGIQIKDSSPAWSNLTQQSLLLAHEFATFDYKYGHLKNSVKNLEQEIHKIDEYLLDKASFIKSTPTILPTRGWITSFYGPRKSPYSGRLKMHEGLDIGARSGTNIVSTADGIVTYSGHKPGLGNFVQIDHGYGIETVFGHAKKLFVRNGQKVGRWDKIAQVGSTGLSTGPHVHYEVRVNGIAVDPLYFILD